MSATRSQELPLRVLLLSRLPALFVAGAHPPRPRSDVSSTRKARHVGPDLGQQHPGRAGAHARNPIPSFELFVNRANTLGHFSA
jgi:hypothetical protein